MAKTEMTFELAKEILLNGDFSSNEFYEAKRFMENHPDGAKILEEVKKREDAFRKENNLESDDIDMYERNAKSLQDNANRYYMGDIKGKKMLGALVDRVNVIEKDEETNGEVLTTPERKNEYLKLILAAKKVETAQVLIGSKEYDKATPEEKEKIYIETVNDRFFACVAQLSGASAVKQPEGKELEIGTKENSAWVKKNADLMRSAVDAAVNTGHKLRLNADAILVSIADTADQTQALVNQLQEKARKLGTAAHTKLNNIAVRFLKRKNDVEENAEKTSRGRYKKIKAAIAAVKEAIPAIKDSAKDNAWKIGGNIAAAAGLALTVNLAPALAASAMMTYGAYHAVSSWIYPIVAEKRKASRLAKEAGQKLGWKEAWKQGYKNATKDKDGKEKKSYYIQGTLNSVLGLVGGAVLARHIAAAQGAKEAIASARFASRLGRSVAPSAAQLTDAGISYCSAPNDKTNVARAKQTATWALASGALGAGITFLTGGISAHGTEDVISDASNGVVPPSGAAVDTLTTPADTTGLDGIAPVEEVVETVEVHHFPTEWSKDMGISERQYNTIVKTMEGTLSHLTDDYGREIPVSLDKAYNNLSDDVMENVFPGKTREQVLYGYNRLYGFMRRAYEVGDGTLRETPHGVDALYNKFSKTLSSEDAIKAAVWGQSHTYAGKGEISLGLQELFPDAKKTDISKMTQIVMSNRRFWSHSEEMEGMIKLLGCNEKPTPELAAKMNAFIENSEKFIAENASADNRNRLTGFVNDCDDKGQWLQGKAPEPKVPVINDEIDIVDDDIVIKEDNIKFDDKPLKVKLMEKKVVQEPEQYGRKYVSEFDSDDYQHVKGEKTLTNEEVNKAHRFHRKMNGGRE